MLSQSFNILALWSVPTWGTKPTARAPNPKAPIPEQASMRLWMESHEGGSETKIPVSGEDPNLKKGLTLSTTASMNVYQHFPSVKNPSKWKGTSPGTENIKWSWWRMSKTRIVATVLMVWPQRSSDQSSKNLTIAEIG